MLQLTVVNDMLATLGEAPLNSLTDDHEFKAAAMQALDSHNRSVQSKGWWFNRFRVTLPVSLAGTITVPGDTLLYRSDTPLVMRLGSTLYDNARMTDQFTKSDTGEIVKLLQFEQLEELPATCIAAAATAWFQIHYDGDSNKAQALAQRLQRLHADLGTEEIRQVGANVLDNNVRLLRIKSNFMRRY